MAQRGEECDVAVVGWGLQGRVLADVIAEHGWRTFAIAPEDSGLAPVSDSQRMYCILQTGILLVPLEWLEAREHEAQLAAEWEDVKAIRPEGRNLLRRYAVAEAPQNGLLRLDKSPSGMAGRLYELTSVMITRIHGRDAEDRLGPLYESGAIYFEIPDSLFDAGEIMTRASTHARAAGVDVLEGKPELRSRDGDRLAVRCGGRLLLPEVTFLCAGTGNLRYLDSLGFRHDLKLQVRAKVVFRAGDIHGFRVPLLVDKRRPNFCYAMRYTPADGSDAGHVCISTDSHRPRGLMQLDTWKLLKQEHIDEAHGHLTPKMKAVLGHRWLPTAAHEVWSYNPRRGKHTPMFAPVFRKLSPRVALRFPGRALRALEGIEEMISFVKRAIGSRRTQTRSSARTEARTRMHYEYPGLDDRE